MSCGLQVQGFSTAWPISACAACVYCGLQVQGEARGMWRVYCGLEQWPDALRVAQGPLQRDEVRWGAGRRGGWPLIDRSKKASTSKDGGVG